tara:strand:- start:9668 stop:10321 length:654 start_codon:yes stop_codon:yes gene_type:complete
MAVTIEKILDLKYDEIITLNLIEKDEDLCGIFKEDINLPFTMLYRMAKDDSLNDDIKSLVFELFDKVICCKKNYVDKYLRLQNAGLKTLVIDPVSFPVENINPIEFIERDTTTLSTKVAVVELEIKLPNTKKEKETPRRYGKVAIQEDILKQGGRPTNAQRAALALNRMKNIRTNVAARLVKDMLLDDKILSDEDYRNIISGVNIIEAKWKKFLKKK